MTEKASKHTTEYLDYLKSKEWRAKRKQILDRDKCTCQICKWKPTKQHLHVHHLHYKNLFNENLDDLILLCEDCHGKVHKPLVVGVVFFTSTLKDVFEFFIVVDCRQYAVKFCLRNCSAEVQLV